MRRKIPYGTTAQLTTNTVQEREIAYDTTLDRLIYGDGVAVAGVSVAKKSEIDTLPATTVAGAALVTATGATAARALADRFADSLTPKDFGAVGDGITDDYAAIAAAIAAANAENSGGGVVRLPAGIYAVGTEISLPSVFLVGDGAQGTIIKPLAPMTAVINITDGLAGVESLQIVNASSYATSGVRVTKSANDLFVRIANNYITNFTNGVLWSSGDHPQIEANLFNSNITHLKIVEDGRNGFVDNNYTLAGHGVDISFTTQQCEGLRITNNTFLPVSSNTHGIKITGGLKLHIGHNIIDQVGSGGNGIWFNGTSAISRISLEGNWIDGGATSGASLKSNGAVNQVKSKGNTYSGGTNTIGIDADGLSRSQFTLDDTHDLTGKAFEFTSCAQVCVVGCDFDVGAQGTEDSSCSIYWIATDGVPSARSSSSVYLRNFNDASGQQLGTPASGLLTNCTGLPVRHVMTLTANGVLNAATTLYIGGGLSAGEASVNIIAPFDITLKTIYAKQSASPGAGQSVTYTVRANGSDTALACTISDAATTANDSDAGIAVSAGQIISVKVVSSAGATATVPAATLGYEATSG